ncbi:MAG: glycosyltransferase family 2 protein, partial [bacterium]|nr:glycosyltransferase family 2 protein [bacterium]
MDLSIIIVSFNVKEFLEQAINSIKQSCRNIAYELFVVDNASRDGSVEFIQRKFPEAHLIANLENRGFAAANNQAIKLASGKFILLINPDTIVQEDTFSVILNFFDRHPECGMVGCKIMNPDGSLQLACRRSFPTPWVAFTKIIGLSKLFPNTKLFGRYNLTYLDPDQTYEVEAISGSFMFFGRAVIDKVGHLDESFFMYGEDLDWCFRTREAGWKIYYLPDTKIIHFKGESSKKSDKDLIIQFYRAMKLFVEKHYHNRYLHVPQWLLMVGITLRASLTFLARFFSSILPGLIDLLLINISVISGIYIRFQTLRYLGLYLIVMAVYSVIWMCCLALVGSYSRSKYSSLRATYGVLIGLILNTS